MPDLPDRRRTETEVYGAAEDSRLLADAAVEGVDEDALVLDVGTGSGYVADRVVTECGARVVASDINPHACREARERGLETVRADLVSPFREGTFDVVLFNPPYLPSDEEAAHDDWMERALSGGVTGRAVIEPFLATVGRVLAPEGSVFILVSSLTDIETVAAFADSQGLAPTTVAEEKHPWERLAVLEITPMH